MFAVIFEVHPKPEQYAAYLGHAARLRPALERIEGFLDNERFASELREGWLVSLSIWRDEAALIRWRSHGGHRETQLQGRAEVFRDYRLRVGEVVADTAAPDGTALPPRHLAVAAAGGGRIVTLTEPPANARPTGPGAGEWFTSITEPGHVLLLQSWPDATVATAWLDVQPAAARQRGVRVVRDYGMFDRAEAPQYAPPVSRPAAGTP